jgi:hypothetical protein
MSKELWLSASRIKSYLACSWKYWGKYHLKLPSESNFGAARGSACHDLFACLIKKDRRDYVEKIIKDKTIKNIPSVVRFINWKMKSQGFPDELDNKGVNNFELIDEMIYVGLAYDFFCSKEELIYDHIEELFKLESEDPKYKILGYIDKVSKNKNVAAIRDYKSSSNKFTDSELEWEVQALSYLLYCKRALGMSGFVEFIFLRYPDNPISKVEVTDDELDMFEYWLADVYEHLENFDEESATEHYAMDDGWLNKEKGFKGAAMCGYGKFPDHRYSESHKDPNKRGQPYYVCECAFPFQYFVALDEDGKILASSKDIGELSGYKNIDTRYYSGCPRKTNTPEFQNWLKSQSE